jgi:peptidoglycan hydrolase-like protein with peptidoglycan-binding domain
VTWTPAPNYRYAVKNGMNGVDVWAIQQNLVAVGYNLTADGAFGPITEKAVRDFQTGQRLDVDGVCGPASQRALCLTLSDGPSRNSRLPDGLLKGLMANESGFIIPAYSPHPTGGGFDLGPYQQAFPPAVKNDTNYAAAYNAKAMATQTAAEMRKQKDIFRKAPKVKDDKYAWQLAALNHNWPAAAYGLANQGSIFSDPKQDTQPAAWVESASGGALHTPREWCSAYIAKACVFVYLAVWPA